LNAVGANRQTAPAVGLDDKGNRHYHDEERRASTQRSNCPRSRSCRRSNEGPAQSPEAREDYVSRSARQ
jgi:hypothetical protein